MGNEIATAKQFDLSPQSFDQALTLSQYLADSDMVPKDFKGKPGNCLVAMQWGMELGLKPLQAMQNLAVINGRPSLWGDAVIALVRSSPACEYVIETQTDEVATCRVKRRGEPEQERTFSKLDAKLAGLLGKQGPWSQYPKRMMQMRARAFAMRDVFPDVLRGLPVAEEVMDMPKDMGMAHEVPKWSDTHYEAAQQASAQGAKAYQAWWKTLSDTERKALVSTKEHEHFKASAIAADKSRTVEDARTVDAAPAKPTAQQQPAAKSFDEVMAMLCQAKTEDELMVAGDWAGAVQDPAERQLLDDKFDERLAEMRGAQ
jgi:hypothetical protein